MDIGRLEVMAQREHWQQRSVSRLIAKVVFKFSPRKLWAALRFRSDKLGVLMRAIKDVTHEWESYAAKVAATAKTSYHLVWIFTCHLHLLLCLQTDDCLMQGHMIEHGSESVFATRSGCCKLNGLGYGRA